MIINLVLAIIAYKLKALNTKAIILAYVIGVVILFSCFEAYILLLVYFITVLIVEKILLNSKKEKRSSIQVLANIVFAFVALIFYILKDESKYFVIYCCMLSVSLCDTLSSTVGTRLAKKVYSITKLKMISNGISGGVSFVGSFAGFTGSLFLASIYLTIAYITKAEVSTTSFMIIWFSGFTGMIIDSILGDVLQKKYQCVICGKVKDTKDCCGSNCQSIGISLLTNTQVNIISEGIVFVILLLIL